MYTFLYNPARNPFEVGPDTSFLFPHRRRCKTLAGSGTEHAQGRELVIDRSIKALVPHVIGAIQHEQYI